MKIAILNCVNKKHEIKQQAQDLYYGISWDAKSAFVKTRYDKWYILSAKYGLIEPTTIIEPYTWRVDFLTRRQVRYKLSIVHQ